MLTKELLKQLDLYVEENYIIPNREKFKPRRKDGVDISFDYYIVKDCVCECIKAPLERRLEKKLSAADEETFAEYLLRYMNERGADPVEVYKQAHLDRRFLSKLRTNRHYKPHKRTLIAIVFGLELSIDEAQDLLKRGGYYLSPYDKTDVIASFFLEQKIYNLFDVNESLDDHGCKPLGC